MHSARYLASARSGGGPFLLECLTHRVRGHYEGDPGRYRETLAEAEWKEKDPILRLERHGLAAGWFAEDELARDRLGGRGGGGGCRALRAREPVPAAWLVEAAVYADG